MAIGGGYLPPVLVEIEGTAKPFLATLAKSRAELAAWAKQDPMAKLGLRMGEFESDLTAAKKQLLDFATQVTNAKLGATADQFWTEIAALRAQMAAMSPLDINVDANVAQAMAQVDMLRGNLAGLQTEGLVGAAGGGDAGGGGGGGRGALGGALTAMALLHTAHLFTPEVLGLASALVAVGAGFTALGVASIGAASDIYAGFHAVSTAQNAIATAIPGTTQWTTAVGQLGAAWSGIPGALQPAVTAINNLMQSFGKTPMAKEIQGFLGAQAGTIAGMFSKGGSTFAPLILATERAVQTIEGMISHAMGSGGLGRLVGSLAKMVGPATVELAQLATALAQVGLAFAHAIQGGQGMQTLVDLARMLAQVFNSSIFQGFITGWTDFDRILAEVIGGLFKVIGYAVRVDSGLKGIGTVVGFAASAFLAFRAVLFVLGKVGVGVDGLYKSTGKFLGLAGGIGLMGVGLTGLVQNFSTLLHVSDPLKSAFHAVASWLGVASTAASTANQTINGFTLSLNGPIKVTGQLSAAMTLLVRSEQSIGSSLTQAATGFATFTHAAATTVNKMIANLKTQNGTIASWAADAQKLIQRGMTPSAVASLAQQAPQDLHAMATATTAQLQQMNVQWQEKLLEAKMSGKQGIAGMITAMETGLRSGTPTVQAAAAALATTLGQQVNVPFTGTVTSIKQIGAALNTIPTSVLQTLAGHTQNAATAMTKLGGATSAVKAPAASLTNTLLSMGTNLAMLGGGTLMTIKSLAGIFRRTGGAASGASIEVDALAASEDTAAASGVAAAGEEGVGALAGLGGLLGPAGLLAVGAGVVGGLAFGLFHLGQSGPTMRKVSQAVQTLNQKLAQMPTGSVLQLGTDFLQVTKDIQGPLAQLAKLAPSSTGAAVAAAQIGRLTTAMLTDARQADTMQVNMSALGTIFGLTGAQVTTLAQKAGITLKKSLTTGMVRQFRTAMAESGTATEQAAAKAAAGSRGIANSIHQMVNTALQQDPRLASSMAAAMATRVAIASKTGATAIADLVNATQGGLPALEAQDAQWGVTIPQKYLGYFKTAMTKGGHVSISAMANAILASRQTMALAAEGVTGVVTQHLAQALIKHKMPRGGKTAMVAFALAITKEKGHVSRHAEGNAIAAAQAITKKKKTFGTLGTQLMQGLAHGITTGQTAVINAAVAAVGAAIAAAKKKATVHSPSLLAAREIGVPLSQGIAVGITSTQAVVDQAMARVVGSALTPKALMVAAAAAATGAKLAASQGGTNHSLLVAATTLRTAAKAATLAASQAAAANTGAPRWARTMQTATVAKAWTTPKAMATDQALLAAMNAAATSAALAKMTYGGTVHRVTDTSQMARLYTATHPHTAGYPANVTQTIVVNTSSDNPTAVAAAVKTAGRTIAANLVNRLKAGSAS